ncbi:hypothetical protein ACH347_36680 [Saccharopolyspora sp. 5N102]|uniref:hypothetical protein n=1 Tax=Saccharopolyspora sp. 5N102 TaxID=3375155 RepID=UPI003790E6AB
MSLADYLRADMICDALQAAVAARGGEAEDVIFHSSRETRYTSAAFAAGQTTNEIHAAGR